MPYCALWLGVIMWVEVAGFLEGLFSFLLMFCVGFLGASWIIYRRRKRSIRVAVIDKLGVRRTVTLKRGMSAEVDGLIDKIKNRRHENRNGADL